MYMKSTAHPREGPDILGDALVRVVDVFARLEGVVHAVGVVQLQWGDRGVCMCV